MRLALVLALTPALAAAQPLDLKGLLGGPSPAPGPSAAPADEAPGPAQRALLAALEELTGAQAATTLAHFRTSLSKRDMAGDERFPDDQDLRRAADLARALIRDKKIKTAGLSARDGASGQWGYSKTTDAQGRLVLEGEFQVPALPQADVSERNVSRLIKVDQWANSVLHETSHLLNTLLVEFGGFQPKPLAQPLPQPMTFRSKRFWNGLSPLSVCPSGQQCMMKRCQGDEDCYEWSFPKNHGQTANEKAACDLSQAVCNAGSCQAYKRVVDAGR